MKKILNGVDVVVHAAAYAHEGLSVFSPHLISKNIVSGSTSVFSAAYSMALDADTSFATSYKNAQDAEGESYTQFEVSISRSLGGGASVYIDMANISGDLDDSNDGSAFGFGTSVSF